MHALFLAYGLVEGPLNNIVVMVRVLDDLALLNLQILGLRLLEVAQGIHVAVSATSMDSTDVELLDLVRVLCLHAVDELRLLLMSLLVRFGIELFVCYCPGHGPTALVSILIPI